MSTKSLWNSVLSVVGLAAFCAQVASASKTEDPVRVSVTAGAEWTDNRDATADGEDNTSLFISPRIDVVSATERTVFDLFYALSYAYRTDPGDDQDDDDFYHNLGLHVNSRLTPILQLMLSESFSRTLDPQIEDQGTTLRRDSNYYINRVEAGASYEMARRVSVVMRGRHLIKVYDDNAIADQYDEDGLGGSLSLWFQAKKSVGLQLTGDCYAHNCKDGAYDVDRDSLSLYGAVGADKAFSKNLKGSFNAGYKQVDYKDSALETDADPFVRMALEGSATPSTRLTLGLAYELKDSDEYPFASEVFSGVDGRLEWDVTASFTVAATVGYWMARYDQGSVPANYVNQLATDVAWQDYVAENGILIEGDKRTVIAGLEATLRFPGQMALRIAQRLEDVDSDVSQDFTRNSTSLGLTKTF